MRNISNIDELRNKLSYDDVLGVLRWKVSPSNNVKVGSVAGYIRSDGYRMLTIDGVITYAHHVIWMINNGEIPLGYKIDHINGVRSDNRLSNLRLVTHQQNAQNQKRKIT
ncbi:HNH endonuclease, partial [Escherichia coli]